MKQTAMQELLNELNCDSFKELCSNHKYIKDYLESRIESTYLEKEKQQIIDAYNKVSMSTAEQYYNETFKL